MQSRTLRELAEYVGGRVCGDGGVEIRSAATLGRARKGDVSFLVNRKYDKQLQTTKASAVIVGDDSVNSPVDLLVAEDPYYAFMQVVVLLHGHRKHKKVGISANARIADSAKIGTDCQIHDFATVSDGAQIGNGCILYPGVWVGPDVHLGNDCILYPNVIVYEACRIGNRVAINANTTIGGDGFGYATHEGVHHKIPHIGTVIIEDDVEVGSCCAIERGTLGETVIGHGTKLGDSVTVGHGTRIGTHCLLVAQVGIAGSVTIGHHCIIGGQVGIAGHLTIGDNVTIAGQSGVVSDVPAGQTVGGAPAMEVRQARRAYSMIRYLPDMRQEIKTLRNQVRHLDEESNSTNHTSE